MSDHTTADDASRYRLKEEIDTWKSRDPILRLRAFMEKKGIWTEQYQKETEDKAKAVVDDAVKKAEAIEPPDPKDMFTYTYEKLTPRQKKQMKEL